MNELSWSREELLVYWKKIIFWKHETQYIIALPSRLDCLFIKYAYLYNKYDHITLAYVIYIVLI